MSNLAKITEAPVLAAPCPNYILDLPGSAWLSPEQAGLYLGLSAGALNQRRFTGKGPRYAKVGRLIRYRKADLEVWLLGEQVRA